MNRAKRVFKPILAVILLAATLLSSVMTVVAWHDFTQSCTNDFRGTVAKTTVTLHKYEKNHSGDIIPRPVGNAGFLLFRQMHDGTWTQIDGMFATNASGKITVEKLNSGTYKFVETHPGYGYGYDTDGGGNEIREYFFTITPDDAEGLAIVSVMAYNRRRKGGLEISKTVKNKDGSALTPEQLDKQFEFTVTFSDEGTYVYQIFKDGVPAGSKKSLTDGGTLLLRHGEVAVFEDVPVGTYYTVTETPAKGYSVKSGGSSVVTHYEFVPVFTDGETYGCAIGSAAPEPFTSGDMLTLKPGRTATFYLPVYKDGEPGTETIGVSLRSAAKENEFIVTFSDEGTYTYQLHKDGTPVGAPQTLSSGDTLSWASDRSVVFEELPLALRYSVVKTEETDEKGCISVSSNDSSGSIRKDKVSRASFTNTYDEPKEGRVKITVKKIVEGDIPESEKDRVFWFNLTVNGGEPIRFPLKADEQKTFELNSGDTYSVTEEDPFHWGYVQTAAVNGAGTACAPEITIIFTNRYVGTLWIKVEGRKTWDMSHNPTAVLPSYILVQLLADGVVVQTIMVKPDADGNWLYGFVAPMHDGDDNEIKYTVQEVPVPGFVSEVDGFDIKNTRKPAGQATDGFSVKKVITGSRPAADDTFTFKLEAINGAPMPDGSADGVKTITVTGEGERSFGSIEYREAGTYSYRVTEIKGSADCVYDETVYIITVTVKETADGDLVIDSKSFATQGGGNTEYRNAVFTNHYNALDETSVLSRKVWAGANNPSRPGSVTVQLYRDGEPFGEPVTLNASNNWRYIWTNLEKGPVWTVDEIDVPEGYAKSVTGNASDGFVITNTYSIPDEIVTVSGKKTWSHGRNPVEEWPESITVYIKNGNDVIASAVITEADDWAWSFDLAKYDSLGRLIKYTVSESNVPRYTHRVSGYNITNTYRGRNYPGDGPGTDDYTQLTLWLVILALSATTAFIVLWKIFRRRKLRHTSKSQKM
ncbi:MAG: Cna B-type domain-containing protein [Clostridiales bacterium]|nr:Cna B-type domain-containing protein [Clostridiales bacterium]